MVFLCTEWLHDEHVESYGPHIFLTVEHGSFLIIQSNMQNMRLAELIFHFTLNFLWDISDQTEGSVGSHF